MLTAETRIRVEAPLPLPQKATRPALTGDTKIRLSQIVDLKKWVEDQRRYQLGEISETTGLMKTTEGWVTPPHFAAPTSRENNVSRGRSGSGSNEPKQREYSADFKENKKKLTSVLEETKKKLTADEVNAIKEYTKSSRDLNAYSRGKKVDPKKVPQIKAQQKALDNALNKSHVGENVIAYRSINISPDGIDSIIPTNGIPISQVPAGSRNLYLQKQLELGSIQSKETGYISTTINPNYQMNRPKQGQVFLSYKINIPKETHGLYIGDLSNKPHQEELLVIRNYSLDLKKIKYDAKRNRYEIEAEVILKTEDENGR